MIGDAGEQVGDIVLRVESVGLAFADRERIEAVVNDALASGMPRWLVARARPSTKIVRRSASSSKRFTTPRSTAGCRGPFDDVWRVVLGDPENGFDAEDTVYSSQEAAEWLRANAGRLHSGTKFAKRFPRAIK
jgi:hypothetical protein